MPKRLVGIQGAETSIVTRAANKRRFLVLKGDRAMPKRELDEVKALEHIESIDQAGLGESIEKLAGEDPENIDELIEASGVQKAHENSVRAAIRVGGDWIVSLLKGKKKKTTTPATEMEPDDDQKPGRSGASGSNVEKDEGECAKCGADVDKADKFCAACGAAQPDGDDEDGTMGKRKASGADTADDGDDKTMKRKSKVRKAALETLPAGARLTVEALLKAQDAEMDELRHKVAKSDERTGRLEAEKRRGRFIALAREYRHLPGVVADDFASILDKAERALAPAEFEKLCSIHKAADQLISDSLLFTETGSALPGKGESGAFDRVTSMAEDLRKSDPKLSPERARAQIWRQHPELYAQYQAELEDQKRRTRGA